MARQVTILQLRIAYPDDVAEEREALGDVVDELNLIWSRTLGLELELIDWKTHSWPNFDVDGQAVINQELGNDYDIFIGLMWTRFGEPTARAGSGTAEEFELALKKFKDDASSVRIMFYFKDGPPSSLKDLDPDQLKAIGEFKQRVKKEGGLYWEFANLEQFKSSVRMHLSRQVQEWGKSWGGKTAAESTSILAKPEIPEIGSKSDLDEGFLDLLELSQASFERLTEIMQKMSADMESHTADLQDCSREIDLLNRANADLAQRKKSINRMASFLNDYSGKLEHDVPEFSAVFSEALDAMGRAMSIWSEDQLQGKDEAKLVQNQISAMKANLLEYVNTLKSSRENVLAMPRVTSDFNSAKRRMISALDQLITEQERGIKLIEESENQFTRILGNPDLEPQGE